jgi:hypothetical protein
MKGEVVRARAPEPMNGGWRRPWRVCSSGCAEPEQGRDRLALAPRPELSTRQPSAAQSKSELTTLFQQLKASFCYVLSISNMNHIPNSLLH